MASTPRKNATQQPPAEGPWTKAGEIATVVGGIAAIVFGASRVLADAIFKVSELGDGPGRDSRIRQTDLTLLQQASDIGSIKGELRPATDKITAAGDNEAKSFPSV